ncbi:hypothetical protein N0V84_008301 [Fusarium piperis]|uniref:Translation initiation factor 5A-like N-terminal domain-containing protein n=1 Tax=Fusarium piperis TaxID=1435070 RepID=A0A9W8W8E2_9HYPO|nr:hypothetical protein N0V84_008301 [Fusarium piperis]
MRSDQVVTIHSTVQSIFPSTYRESESHTQTVTETHEEVEIKPQKPQAGREGQYSSVSVTAEQVPPREERYSEEEVHITREEERYRRPGVQKFEQEQFTIREEHRRPEPPSQYTTSHVHVETDTHRHPYYSTPVDLAEREYRQRYRPSTAFSTADPPSRPQYQTQDTFQVSNYTVEGRPAPQYHSSEKTEINNFAVEGRSSHPHYHTTEKTTEINNFTVDARSSRPQYHTSEKTEVNNFTVDARSSRPHYNTSEKTEINNFTVDGRSSRPQYNCTEKTEINNFTVDTPSSRPQYNTAKSTHVTEFTVDTPVSRPSYKKDVKFAEETVETSKVTKDNKSKMGYYDEDGHYHSFRSGLHKLGDRIAHPGRREAEHEGPRPRPGDSAEAYLPNTVTIPCHHVRLGDFLVLQGRPCQVIRISTSSATGQYRYLGVDLFTKQLHEESSFVSNPAPSVVVQTMLGPVFKQYRVLDMQEGQIVAMTETGDVKQGLPVIDQSNLYARLSQAFESGRGSVRVLVLNDGGRELAVDMKVIHGSRL